MKGVRLTAFAALGSGLIAVGFGLARFAYGLFVPAIRDGLDLSSAAVGLVGGLAFVSFVATVLTAPAVVRRLGPRGGALASAACGTVGLATIAMADGVILLALGVLTCGISTGLITPAMTQAVQVTIPPARRGRINAVMNAGTTVGVAATVPPAMIWPGAWRSAYWCFAGLALAGLIAARLGLPPRPATTGPDPSPGEPTSTAEWRAMGWLGLLALAMGVVSAPYWVFAPDFVAARGVALSDSVGLIWLAVGLGGLGGAVVGDMIDRLGLTTSHFAAVCLLAAALALLAAAPERSVAVLVSGLAFGAGYMMLTGLYVVAGVGILPARPALGPALPFATLAVGQALGSPLAGLVVDHAGAAIAFATAAILATLLATASPALSRGNAGRRAPDASAG